MSEDLSSADDGLNPNPTPAEEYKVGPGRPPKETRWKKGAPSPNPNGRPRNKSALAPDVRKLLEQSLNRKVSLTRDGRRTTLAKLELGLEQLANQFAKGDRHARRDVFTYGAQLGIDFSGQAQAVKDALAPNHQEILDAFVRRHQSTEAKDDQRVIAPPDLADDDVAKSE